MAVVRNKTTRADLAGPSPRNLIQRASHFGYIRADSRPPDDMHGEVRYGRPHVQQEQNPLPQPPRTHRIRPSDRLRGDQLRFLKAPHGALETRASGIKSRMLWDFVSRLIGGASVRPRAECPPRQPVAVVSI